MFILHIALQGCLRGSDVAYGLTPDTGGHIRYLLELVAAADARREVARQQIVTRRFDVAGLGPSYAAPVEPLSRKSEIVRLDGRSPDYVAKEAMAGEIDALKSSLAHHLASLDRLPDVIHAHYADAGTLASWAKARFGIPFVFTAHSLGRVKRLVAGDACRDPALDRRIAAEDAVIAAADAIVASSRDEAEAQYGLYPGADARRIRINPPGCDLALFGGAGPRAGIARLVEPHLDHPERPPILAVARPVRKKNLIGLVEAYGAHPTLREHANLVVLAGCHDRLDRLDPEARAVLAEMSEAIARHGLEGHVAMPVRHEPCDIPAIYRYAAARRGIFANVAHNEPFGLTFLEAAAAGLPVVATRSGGPVDIVGRCRNGVLVDPADPVAIGAALLELVGDDEAWSRAAANGRREVRFYGWERHVDRYLRELAALAGHRPARERRPRHLPRIAGEAPPAARIGVS